MVTIVSPALTFNKPRHLCVHMVLRIGTITFLNIINAVVSLMETYCIFCKVGIAFVNIIYEFHASKVNVLEGDGHDLLEGTTLEFP